MCTRITLRCALLTPLAQQHQLVLVRLLTIPRRATGETKKTNSESPAIDKTSVEFHEHCQSGSDSEAAALVDTAFGKDNTDPEGQRLHAEEESKKVRKSPVNLQGLRLFCFCAC